MEKLDLGVRSIIPRDRVFINGNHSSSDAEVNWIISDVNNFRSRTSQVIAIKIGTIKTDNDWDVIRNGNGLVPLKIYFDIQKSNKTATIIF